MTDRNTQINTEALEHVLKKTMFIIQKMWPYNTVKIDISATIDKHERLMVILGIDGVVQAVDFFDEILTDNRSDEDILFAKTLQVISDYMQELHDWT